MSFLGGSTVRAGPCITPNKMYHRDLYNRIEVGFYDKNIPGDPGFTLTLNQRMNYMEVCTEVQCLYYVCGRRRSKKKMFCDSARDRTGDLECVRLT